MRKKVQEILTKYNLTNNFTIITKEGKQWIKIKDWDYSTVTGEQLEGVKDGIYNLGVLLIFSGPGITAPTKYKEGMK